MPVPSVAARGVCGGAGGEPVPDRRRTAGWDASGRGTGSPPALRSMWLTNRLHSTASSSRPTPLGRLLECRHHAKAILVFYVSIGRAGFRSGPNGDLAGEWLFGATPPVCARMWGSPIRVGRDLEGWLVANSAIAQSPRRTRFADVTRRSVASPAVYAASAAAREVRFPAPLRSWPRRSCRRARPVRARRRLADR